MKRTIIFSKNAEQSLANILEYLEFKWSTKVKEQFIKKLDQSVYLIQTNPDTFPKSQINKNQYGCVVTKQTTLYYRYNSKEIWILSLFDTRQDLTKIKKIK